MLRLAIALLVILLSSVGSRAGTAAELAENCTEMVRGSEIANYSTNRFKAGQCAGFITGVVQMNELYRRTFRTDRPYFCLPDKFTAGEGIDTVYAYFRSNPSAKQLTAISAVIAAFERAYPCRQ